MMRLMKGKDAADEVYREISERMDALRQRGIRPKLAVVLVKGDPASAYYTEAKRKIAERLTVAFELHKLDAGVEQVAVLELIRRLNADRSIHGIMLELPLPAQLNAPDIAAAIAPEKDIDGVTPANRLAVMTGAPGLYPATPQACIRLLRHYGYELAGRNVALVGRGQTVGLPLFHLLQREQATVTVCHSRTPDLAAHLRAADIAVVAAGKPHLVTEAMVHPGLVVVDAGINEVEDGVLTGDVSPGARELVAAASPVPGGVGALTTAVLFRNLLQATEQREAAAGAAGEATNAAAGTGRIWDGTLRGFLARAASAEPTPGGGSVAAVAGALGAAMTAMVGNLSQGDRFGPEISRRMAEAVARMDALTARYDELLEADMAAFGRYMDALRLPKETDGQMLRRKEVLQEAAAAAVDVPLALMALCLEGLRSADAIAEEANRNVISDLGIGAVQFEAAARSALLTVEINLPSLRGEEEKRRLAAEAELLMKETEALSRRIVSVVKGRIT